MLVEDRKPITADLRDFLGRFATRSFPFDIHVAGLSFGRQGTGRWCELKPASFALQADLNILGGFSGRVEARVALFDGRNCVVTVNGETSAQAIYKITDTYFSIYATFPDGQVAKIFFNRDPKRPGQTNVIIRGAHRHAVSFRVPV